MNIRATELFHFAQYGVSYTCSYHQADWKKNKWLTTEAQNFPLQYEVTTQRVIVRVSDVNDLNSERPNVFNVPYDSDSYLMMELTVGNCRRDSQWLQSSVANAINDIQQISNLKITDPVETNFLQDYLPKVDIDSSVNNIGTIRQKPSIPIFTNFIQFKIQKLMNFGHYWTSNIDKTKQFSFTMIQVRKLRNFSQTFTTLTCKDHPNAIPSLANETTQKVLDFLWN
jgi:hypothetical protein